MPSTLLKRARAPSAVFWVPVVFVAQRLVSAGRVVNGRGVVRERRLTDGGVVAAGVGRERPGTHGRVELTGDVGLQRPVPDDRVKRVLSGGVEVCRRAISEDRVATEITADRRRGNRMHAGCQPQDRQRDGGQPETGASPGARDGLQGRG